MPFSIVRNDITKMQVDAIVNAANTNLAMGGGVCGAIFRAACATKLKKACDKLAPIKTGDAVITPAFDLPAKFIIHTAGPVYNATCAKECEIKLYSSYINSLTIAIENGCESIAFPLISSGIYGYPKHLALQVASRAIRDFLETNDIDVYLAVFDNASFAASRALMGSVQEYIDSNYVKKTADRHRALLSVEENAISKAFVKQSLTEESIAFNYVECKDAPLAPKSPICGVVNDNLTDVIGNLDEPFSAALMRLIDAKGLSDAAVYKRANIDRKLFSKIRCAKGYMPSKRTVIALAIALELDIEQADSLLKKAGFALSHSQIFDVIIEYFILNKNYDIYEINEVLFQYDQPLLGA